METLRKQQVGNLLDDRQRISNPTRPKRIPHTIDLRSDFSGNRLEILLLCLSNSQSLETAFGFRLVQFAFHMDEFLQNFQLKQAKTIDAAEFCKFGLILARGVAENLIEP